MSPINSKIPEHHVAIKKHFTNLANILDKLEVVARPVGHWMRKLVILTSTIGFLRLLQRGYVGWEY